jgi:sugar-specific transcriptional regulator TrmB
MAIKGKFLTKRIRKTYCKYENCGRELLTRSSNKQYCRKHREIICKETRKLASESRKSSYIRTEKSISPRDIVREKRNCLKCGEKFSSLSTHNRVCYDCSVVNERCKEGHSIHFGDFGVDFRECEEITQISLNCSDWIPYIK